LIGVMHFQRHSVATIEHLYIQLYSYVILLIGYVHVSTTTD